LAARVNLYVSPASPDTEEIRYYLSNKGIDVHVYDISTEHERT
jgi:arsenate reductase-like glutaredoxin family protein